MRLLFDNELVFDLEPDNTPAALEDMACNCTLYFLKWQHLIS
jgi:hypothetical protein